MDTGGIGGALVQMVASAAEALLTAIWTVSVLMLRTTFEVIDALMGGFDGAGLANGDGNPGPALAIGGLWPTLRWIGAVIALGLFFWQLIMTMMRGGTGFWRLASGPVAYALATALTLGGVAALVGAAEGITTLLLQQGLAADTFSATLTNPKIPFTENPQLGEELTNGTVRAVLLGLVGLFGLIPGSIAYALEMIFRQAAIVVLIATVPITSAGLLTNTTAVWFWKSMRWIVAAVMLKPAVALVLVVGVNMLGQPGTVGALIAGTAVLLLGIFCPFALFRLLAFVDPGTNAGAAARESWGGSGGGGQVADGGGAGPEAANAARFDAAAGAGGGGAAAGGAAGGGAAGGAAMAGAGAASGGTLAAVALAASAVKSAGGAAINYANSAMDASGIGQGYGGAPLPTRSMGSLVGSGMSGGSSSSGGSDDGGGSGGAPAAELDTTPPDQRSDPAPSDIGGGDTSVDTSVDTSGGDGGGERPPSAPVSAPRPGGGPRPPAGGSGGGVMGPGGAV